jgi:hypothetical protein
MPLCVRVSLHVVVHAHMTHTFSFCMATYHLHTLAALLCLCSTRQTRCIQRTGKQPPAERIDHACDERIMSTYVLRPLRLRLLLCLLLLLLLQWQLLPLPLLPLLLRLPSLLHR